MVRVLHVLGTLGLGGAESRIMDLYRHIDRQQVQFDFLVHMDADAYSRALAGGKEPEELRTPEHFDEEVRSLGGNIYALPRFRGINLGRYRKAAERFFSAHHNYSVIQGHMTSTASIYLPIAASFRADSGGSRLPVTVAHTRNAGVDKGLKGILTGMLRKSLPEKADYLFACSHLAGDETFGGAGYTYIPNTIDVNKFNFDLTLRQEVRAKLNMPDDAVVIGNVARFSPQKNQALLIREFADLLEKLKADDADIPVFLVLCGDGALRQDCEKLAEEHGISGKVIFTGNVTDVPAYYSAMDVLAFPSSYEGLPGAVVEAQASGLDCIISDSITRDVCITDKIEQLSIGKPGLWSEAMFERVCMMGEADKAQREELVRDRAGYSDIVRDAGFDVNDQAGLMMRFYLDPCDETLPAFDKQ